MQQYAVDERGYYGEFGVPTSKYCTSALATSKVLSLHPRE